MTAIFAPRVARALQLVEEIEAALLASYLENANLVRVSIDQDDIDKTNYQQHGVVVVLPGPKITYPVPGAGIKQLSWTILLVCKATTKIVDSFIRLDSMLAVLEDFLEISEAVPGNLPRPSGQAALPGYTLTLPDVTQN